MASPVPSTSALHSARIPGLAVGVILLLLILPMAPGSGNGEAQATAQEVVTPERPVPGPVIPPPFFRRALEAGTRSLDGRPGPNYWQVYSEYDIDARLDPAAGLLSGSETIVFHNRSPRDLFTIAVFLHQNIHAEGVPRNYARSEERL